MPPRDKTQMWCMNCYYVFDEEIEANPQWESMTDEDGHTWPVREFYGSLSPVCRRFPPHVNGLVSVAPDGWCGEWRPAYDFSA